jgi:acyl-CoA synthetase (NDP forming)
MTESLLDQLTNPRSITIVGASNDPSRIGGRPLNFMLTKGYGGTIHAVNPTRDTVQGLRAYSSIDAINDTLDFVLIAVPAKLVVETMRAAIAKGARSFMIFSSGFAETSEAGAAEQAEIVALAQRHGVRVVGPNCLGAMSPATGFYPTFSGIAERIDPVPGGLGIASQSGAYGSHIFYICHQRGLGVRYWLTTGNECDVHVSELIGAMVEDDAVHAIAAYVESVKDGPALVEALEAARAARKPVFVMKVGRSASGAAAASSHTASLAGEDAVYDAVLQRHGAFRVDSTEQMIDLAIAARPRIYPVGRRVGLVTISGGAGILMADVAEAEGLDVAPMPQDAQDALRAVLPFAGPRNPVDVTAQFFNDMSLIPRFTTEMLDRGGYHGMVGFWTSVAGAPALTQPLLDGLKSAMAGRNDRLFIQSLVASPQIVKLFEDEGFPCFEDPSRAVEAMAAMMRLGEAFAAERPLVPPPLDLSPLPQGPLGETEARALLGDAGMAVAPSVLATSADEAATAARAMGGAVALKIASPDIAHKTDAGGVRLGVAPDDVLGAFDTIMKSVRANAPGARLDGVLVSPMAQDGVDCILGARIDPVFGPVVVFGLGGIFAEILQDVALCPAPFGPDTARAMIDSLKGAALLKGARGAVPCDLDALSAQISRFSRIAAAWRNDLDSMEINPLRARPEGCAALDALIVRREHKEDDQ